MDSRAAIRLNLNMADMVSMSYVEDLTDDEMLHRPCAGANHIKWQMGHLITSEHQIIEGVAPDSMPPLPAGFAEKYTKETAASDDPAAFDSRAALLEAYKAQRAATLAALEKQTDESLDQPGPEEMKQYAPTVAAAFSLQGGHWMMHAGQWAVIRRQLGRPPLF